MWRVAKGDSGLRVVLDFYSSEREKLMSSDRYSESRTYREESRKSTDPYNTSYNQRVTMPIQQSSSSFTSSGINDQPLKDRIRQQDTTLQWVNDPISGKEKFRININIDGFDRNEVCQYLSFARRISLILFN